MFSWRDLKNLLTVAAIHFFSFTNWLYTTRQSDEGEQTSHWCLACFFNRQLVDRGRDRLTMLTMRCQPWFDVLCLLGVVECYIPENTGCSKVSSKLNHSLRHWPSFEPTLGQHLLFAVSVLWLPVRPTQQTQYCIGIIWFCDIDLSLVGECLWFAGCRVGLVSMLTEYSPEFILLTANIIISQTLQ